MHVQADILARMFRRFRRQNPTFRKKFRTPLRDLHVPDSGEADDDQSGGGGHDQGQGLLPCRRNQQPNVKFSSGLSQTSKKVRLSTGPYRTPRLQEIFVPVSSANITALQGVPE